MEQNKTFNDEEREMNLKILFANVLKQWRKVLIAMLIFCVLLVAYKSYKLKSTVTSVTETNTLSVEEQKDATEKEIQNTEESIKALNDYIKNSIYASIDPYDEVDTSADIAITTTSNLDGIESLLKNTNHANQIAQAYSTYILKTINYDSIANKMNLNKDYIKEIISAKPDFNSDIVTLNVIGSDSEQTEEIASYIIQQVKNEQEDMKLYYGDHTVVTSKIVTNTKVDYDLLSTQTNANTTASYSNNVAMTQAVTRLNTLKTNLISEQTVLESIGSSSSSSSNISLKTVIKYGLLGMIGGLILSVLFYAIKFSVEGKIASENDVKNIYGLKILSVLPMNPRDKKLSKVDIIAYRQIDSAFGVDKDIAIEKVMTNMSGFAENKKNVLLVGTDLKQDLNDFQSKLQDLNNNIQFSLSLNINANSKELEKLKTTDGVILVTQRYETRFDDLTKSVETIDNWKKDIIGSIVL